jgi:ABC-2 type transport system permease protein
VITGTFHLTNHEIKKLLVVPGTWMALSLAAFMMGFFYFLMLIESAAHEQELPPPTLFFSLFWIPVLLMVPMLTMRSFAEEQRIGTMETLLTAPVSTAQIVLSKFLATWLLYCTVWLGSMVFPWITSFILQQPQITQRLFDSGALQGGLLFVFISGALFVAIGIFTSSLTRSQLVAGMLSFSILFILIIGLASASLLQMDTQSAIILDNRILAYLRIFDHFEDFSQGVIDSRPFAYYGSSTLAVLGLAVLVLDSKR